MTEDFEMLVDSEPQLIARPTRTGLSQDELIDELMRLQEQLFPFAKQISKLTACFTSRGLVPTSLNRMAWPTFALGRDYGFRASLELLCETVKRLCAELEKVDLPDYRKKDLQTLYEDFNKIPPRITVIYRTLSLIKEAGRSHLLGNEELAVRRLMRTIKTMQLRTVSVRKGVKSYREVLSY
ncbi:MAG: hypothetical protein Q9227_001575 [Pyrenula ochraceoflavens]